MGEAGKEFYVLDRHNPLGRERVEGMVIDVEAARNVVAGEPLKRFNRVEVSPISGPSEIRKP